MASPTDIQIKAASEAAQMFVDGYYHVLNTRKTGSTTLSTFYINSAKYPIPADISINGHVVPTPEALAALLDKQGADVSYEIESFDAHVVNPDFSIGAPESMQEPSKSGSKTSVMAQVTGRVYYGKGRDAPKKTFNEVFVLVPNWEWYGRNAPKGLRRWLIMSQNFRAL